MCRVSICDAFISIGIAVSDAMAAKWTLWNATTRVYLWPVRHWPPHNSSVCFQFRCVCCHFMFGHLHNKNSRDNNNTLVWEKKRKSIKWKLPNGEKCWSRFYKYVQHLYRYLYIITSIFSLFRFCLVHAKNHPTNGF